VRAVRIARTGGPEVLATEDVPTPEPRPGEIRVRHEAVGLNFIDVYHRTGLYPVALPSGLGVEAAGIVEAVGEGVTRFAVGDRVGYTGGRPGAYAEAHCVAVSSAVRLPDGVDSRTAAAALLKGMTAEFLLRRCYPVQPGDVILAHAAAGGVGLILCQWAKALGATVIGAVGSEAKAAIAREHGCDHVILYREEDVAGRVREITGGKGVPVVYDSVGAATFEGSLKSLRPRGLMVSFGNASGPAPPVAPGRLAQGGSLFLTRPTLFDYVATTEELDASAAALWAVIASGAVRVEIGAERPLAEVRAAHEALEARETTGATLLIP
jgi:NADPH2:quinone reductase